MLPGTRHNQLDFGPNLRVKRFIRFVLSIGRRRIFVRGTKARFNPAPNLAQHDPFLPHFMISQETARQQGMPTVVEGQISQGRATAALDEEGELGPVALFGGIVGPLDPHRSAQKLHNRI